MPSFVYCCKQCSAELRFLVSRALDKDISVHCPECNDVKQFSLVREGNIGKDWFSQVLIENKKRREGDDLYKSDEREEAFPEEKIA